jgi:hypothetical protein
MKTQDRLGDPEADCRPLGVVASRPWRLLEKLGAAEEAQANVWRLLEKLGAAEEAQANVWRLLEKLGAAEAAPREGGSKVRTPAQ